MSSPVEEHDYIWLSDVSSPDNIKTELRLGLPGYESPKRVNGSGLALSFNVKGFGSRSKSGFNDCINRSPKWIFGDSEVEPFSPKKGESGSSGAGNDSQKKVSAAQAQVVGWPPLRNSRKNIMANNSSHAKNREDDSGCLYIKVSMDGAPYLRKVDLKTFNNYKEFSLALDKMFSFFTNVSIELGQCGSKSELIEKSENVLTYEDKDGDWMLVGDVPWGMFTETCRRLRIMKGSNAIGLAPRVAEKCKSQN